MKNFEMPTIYNDKYKISSSARTETNQCGGCRYCVDKKKIQGGGFIWGSVIPHPCTTCSRFTEKDDNYEQK